MPLRWGLAGGKPQAAGGLMALAGNGFVPDFVMVPQGLPAADHAEMAAAAAQIGTPLLENDKTRLAALSARLDILLVCRFELVPPEVFAAPRIAALNIHSSLLPSYRGVHPVSWALVDGVEETGVTIHRIDAGIDTGPIVAQSVQPIHDHHDLWSLTKDLDRLAADLAVEVFRHIAASGTLPPAIAPRHPSSYGRRRTAADGRIDWQKPARAVFDLVRALPPPMPPAFTTGPDGTMTAVLTARQAVTSPLADARPGTVLAVDDQGWAEIQCGGGSRLQARLDPMPIPGTQFT